MSMHEARPLVDHIPLIHIPLIHIRDISMRDVAVELRSLDQIATLLVNQQSCRAGTNPGTPLPSVSAVMTIVRELRNVLFPGIH